MLQQYLKLSQDVAANVNSNYASGDADFDKIYQKLTDKNRTQLAVNLLAHQSLLTHNSEQLIAYYPSELITELAANKHIKSMWYLANNAGFENNIWHEKLLNLDYQYAWQHARVLGDAANNQAQQHHAILIYQQALALLESRKTEKTAAVLADRSALQNQIVRYAIEKRLPQWPQLLHQYQTASIQLWLNSYRKHYLHEQKWLNILHSDIVSRNCDRPLSIIASAPWDLLRLKKLTQQMLQSQIGEGFCIQQILWLDDLQQVEKQLRQNSNAYWLIMRPVQRAYRVHRQIHIPATAGLKLLQHEVAHWLGFEDEYALRKELANIRCAAPKLNQTIWSMGVNIVAVKDHTYFSSIEEAYSLLLPHINWLPQISHLEKFLHKKPQGWVIKSLSSETEQATTIGLYPANTCDKYFGVTAYKPLVELSFMYNYELDIPKFYKKHLIGDG